MQSMYEKIYGLVNLELCNLICDLWSTLQESFQRLLHKQDGTRAEWEYPFAVAGINISFMLVQMLDLQSGKKKKRFSVKKISFFFFFPWVNIIGALALFLFTVT